MLGLVDWELLVLFMGLFVVNHALQKTGLPARVMEDLTTAGVPLQHPGPLFAATFVLSNLVSNVPAVMLLLPGAQHALAGPTLATGQHAVGNLLVSAASPTSSWSTPQHARRADIMATACARGYPSNLGHTRDHSGYLGLRLRQEV